MDTQYSGKLTGKMLYFMEDTDGAFDAANDCVAIPVERFKGFRNVSATAAVNELTMEFDPMLGYSGAHDDATFVADSVELTITDNKHKEVMEDILNLIHGTHSDGFIVISDDSNSVFASDYITGCAITITAEA